ncbi:MAG: Outer membrane usher protein PapC [Candidatus Erwinia impunctatus]|nr:Outer membrane usher protein PapC [Culicoides impunctatus]
MSCWKLRPCAVLLIASFAFPAWSVEFNTDILDAEDKSNIDLSRFSQAGYIMPGTYSFTVKLNEKTITEQDIDFKETHPDQSSEVVVRACFSPAQIDLLGLKEQALKKISFDNQEHCADLSALQGVVLRGDMSKSTLFITIPQVWLEYNSPNWLPPARWEDGIPGAMFDYTINSSFTRNQHQGNARNISGTGTAGANYGPWRLRGDWQANYIKDRQESSSSHLDWSRIYAFRALRSMMSRLMVGEDYLNSDLFDAWRFTGASLMSDESQLAPNLRGYAPEVAGVARTNAKVVVSQQGRVIYESNVAAGPFRIQELNNAINSELDVRVEEQDGTAQTFQVTSASVPYLTRPGQVRYKFATGRPSNYQHKMEGPLFATSEVSWGVSNNWSVYAGAIMSQKYTSLAVGLGRDLYKLGALSVDVTQSVVVN